MELLSLPCTTCCTKGRFCTIGKSLGCCHSWWFVILSSCHSIPYFLSGATLLVHHTHTPFGASHTHTPFWCITHTHTHPFGASHAPFWCITHTHTLLVHLTHTLLVHLTHPFGASHTLLMHLTHPFGASQTLLVHLTHPFGASHTPFWCITLTHNLLVHHTHTHPFGASHSHTHTQLPY